MTNCLRCKSKIKVEVEETSMMFYCPKCSVMVANPFFKKNTKEVQMPTKKKTTKAEKETTSDEQVTKKEKTESISRDFVKAEAQKVLDFLNQNSNTKEASVQTKILSKAYTLAAAKKN